MMGRLASWIPMRLSLWYLCASLEESGSPSFLGRWQRLLAALSGPGMRPEGPVLRRSNVGRNKQRTAESETGTAKGGFTAAGGNGGKAVRGLAPRERL